MVVSLNELFCKFVNKSKMPPRKKSHVTLKNDSVLVYHIDKNTFHKRLYLLGKH